MKFKIKKLLKIFSIVSVILILCFCSLLNHSLVKDRNDLEKQNTVLTTAVEKQIERIKIIEDSLNKSTEDFKSTKESLEAKEKEIEELKRSFEELEEKYLEEIKPVTYNPYNLWEESNATVHDLTVALLGTGLEGLEQAYLTAEEEWGVSAIFLISVTAEESGWGTSDRAIYQNNLSGYGVYSSTAEGVTFASKEESILRTAQLICEDYLKPGGKYHNGIGIQDVNIRYCPNDGGAWSRNINSIANTLVAKINNY